MFWRRRAAAIAVTAAAMIGAAPAAQADEATFHAVFGQLVFDDAQARQQTRTVLEAYVSRSNFTTPTIADVAPGKYGAGPALLVTFRLDVRADADAVWADVTRNVVLNRLRPTSQLRQSSVTFDPETGTQTVTVVHKLTVPAEPDDQ